MVVVEVGARLTYFGLSSEYFLAAGGGCAPLDGRAGSWLSPQAGALIRVAESVDLLRADGALDEAVSFVPLDAVDATEPLLCSSSDPFRLGRGGGCFLAGLGGGAG